MAKIIQILAGLFLVIIWISDDKIFAASQYGLYVDANTNQTVQDGSLQYPFKTISAALESVKENDGLDTTIHIAKGQYIENVVLESRIKLIGEGKESIIFPGGGTALIIKDYNEISNLKISNANIGIEIVGSPVLIDNVYIEDMQSIGINIKKSKASENNEIKVTNSTIENSRGKGIYVERSYINFQGNTIRNNNQEGIDIRQSVKGKIEKNRITSNKESGIEVIIGKANILITRNRISNNRGSGIATQYYPQYKETGEIAIKNNNILSNKGYAIDCQTTQGGGMKSTYWTKSTTITKNSISKNKQGKYADICHLGKNRSKDKEKQNESKQANKQKS